LEREYDGLYPDTSLSDGTTYTATIETGAKDAAGNGLQAPYSWQFITASVSDTTPQRLPEIRQTGTNVPVTTQITLTFSEAMNQSSAQSAFSTSLQPQELQLERE